VKKTGDSLWGFPVFFVHPCNHRDSVNHRGSLRKIFWQAAPGIFCIFSMFLKFAAFENVVLSGGGKP
jgi:hypothetical protein